MEQIILKYSSEEILKTAYTDPAGIDIPVNKLLVPYRSETESLRIFGILLKTGTICELPKGFSAFLKFRSGVIKRFVEKGILFHTDFGLIDNDYRGELIFYFTVSTAEKYISITDIESMLGKYPLQLVLFPYSNVYLLKVDSIESNTERGENGLGSSN